MERGSDFALLGTGVAPLVAAARLIAKGRSVLLLNPDWDYFAENSELPLDPLWPTADGAGPTLEDLAASSPDLTLAALRPDFPGAVESWVADSHSQPGSGGYHDFRAPHARARARLWVRSEAALSDPAYARRWEAIEDLYVAASDAGVRPQLFEGMGASKAFPGYSGPGDDHYRGISFPRLCDVDVARYRNGLLEFIRERVGRERVLSGAHPIEITREGLRVYVDGRHEVFPVGQELLVFWTPRISAWLAQLARAAETTLPKPRARVWEQWELLSREPLDPGTVGVFEDLTVWANCEGVPLGEARGLSALRAGPVAAFEDGREIDASGAWMSRDSFESLFRLCQGFLRWEKFSVREARARLAFEWPSSSPSALTITHQGLRARVITGCDGPLHKVARRAREAAENAGADLAASVAPNRPRRGETP